MSRHAVAALFALFVAVAMPSTSQAGPSPAGAGWIVGASTFGGSTVGVVGGFAAGAALGGSGCNTDQPHQCGFAPIAFGTLGAGLGAMITTPITTHFTAKAVGADPRRVLRDVGITAGVSAGVLVLGTFATSPALQLSAVAGLAIALPVVAGYSTAQTVRIKQKGVAWGISPHVNGRTTGLTVSGIF